MEEVISNDFWIFDLLTYFINIQDRATKLGQIVGLVSRNISNYFWPLDLQAYFLKFEDIVTKLSQKLEEVICNDFWKFDLLS